MTSRHTRRAGYSLLELLAQASAAGRVVVNVSPAQAAELQTYAWLACQDVKKLMRTDWRY
jgi:hypothetical protein